MNVNESMSQSSNESTEGSFEELEDPAESLSVKCLFCDSTLSSVPMAISHCQSNHNFDIYSIRDKFELDHYSYIKLINYIRLEKPDPRSIAEKPVTQWQDDKFLKPSDMEDAWLWYDLEGLKEKTEKDKLGKYVNVSENGNVTMSNEHFVELQETILRLNEEVKKKDEIITRLKEINIAFEKELPPASVVSDLNNQEDSQYFLSYSSPSIHWEMLKDEVRTKSFQNAICQNLTMFNGSTVLDVGSGTGILSLMAATAGARKVIGVEDSDMFYYALDVIRENNLHEKVELVKGKVEQVYLPISEKVDVIISEWMGYFLLFEGMIDSLIFTREKYLKPDGVILPTHCYLKILGCSDLDLHNGYVKFWSNVYGFDMSAILPLFIREGVVDIIEPETIVTNSFVILELDMKTCCVEDTIFQKQFSLTCIKNCELTHIVGYFDVHFELEFPSSFSTSPKQQNTHWKQTSFFLKNKISMEKGEVIHGSISVRRNVKQLRSLIVELKIKDEKLQTFYLR